MGGWLGLEACGFCWQKSWRAVLLDGDTGPVIEVSELSPPSLELELGSGWVPPLRKLRSLHGGGAAGHARQCQAIPAPLGL